MQIRTQPNDYSCGIYSIINSLIVFGDSKSPKEVGEFTFTTENGTTEKGIINALNNFGYKTKVYKSSNGENAWRWILNNSINYPLILYVDNDHWIVIAGRISNKVILIDSWEKAEIIGKELLERWYCSREYFGIKVYR